MSSSFSPAAPGTAAGADQVALALETVLPGLAAADPTANWSELGLDSFDLLSLRLVLEEALGAEIADMDWVAAGSPAELALVVARSDGRRPAAEAPAVALRETVEIGMPQMALCGLSESWLLKALGDWHWRLIGAALQARPVAITDSFGNRLYPAFTRLRFVSNRPLAAFEEGERLDIEASLSRYGAGIFFSSIAIAGAEGRTIAAELMSTFALRSAAGGNGQLLRGQPLLPDPCAAPALAEMPRFGAAYGEKRRRKDLVQPILARCSYELLPQYDINGVGLVYYAAYPMMADICQMRVHAEGTAWATGTSVVARDICYFANADPGAILEWRLHRDAGGDGLATEASIVRDDGVVMALVSSRKERL